MKKVALLLIMIGIFNMMSACGQKEERENAVEVESVEQGTAEEQKTAEAEEQETAEAEEQAAAEEPQEGKEDIQIEEAANDNEEENADDVVDSADNGQEINAAADFEEFIKNHNAYEYPLELFCRALKEHNGELLVSVYGTFFTDYMVNEKGYTENDVLWEYRDLCTGMNIEFSEEYGEDFDVSYEYGEVLCDEGELQSIYQKLTEEYGFKGELEEAYSGHFNINIEGEKGSGSKYVGKAVVGKLDGQWHILPPDI